MMNPKIRALLWEELRVSGAIAGACGVVALIGQLALRIDWRGNPWHAVSEMVLTIALGAPVLMGLLFTLSAGNSGHLAGGFSRRILRLPVDTWSAVLVVLFTRLIEMLAVSAFLAGACRLIYGQGPGVRVIFVLASVYLLVQVLDWMRAVAAMVTWVSIAALSVSLLVRMRGVSSWTEIQVLSGSVTPLFLLGFATWVAAAYGVSLLLVHWTRSGERFSPLSAPSFDTLISLPAPERRKPFRSAFAAQVWFEMRRAGLFFPAAVLVFWVAGLAIFWLGTAYVDAPASSLALTMKIAQAKGMGVVPTPGNSHTFWILEILPFIALVLASFAWGAWFTVRRGSAKSSGRPAIFTARQPITKAMAAKARLAVAGVNLALVLAVISVISILSFLYTDRALVLRILYEELVSNETSLRELAQIVLGPTLLVGLLAWVILNPNIGTATAFTLFVCGGILLGGAKVGGHSSPAQYWQFGLGVYLSWIAVLFPIVWLGQSLCTLVWKGILSRKSFAACLLAWVVFAFALFPFAFVQTDRAEPWSLVIAVALSALLVLSYVSTVQGQCRRERWELLAVENPAQHRRIPSAKNPWRPVMAVAAVAILAALAWMRWPAEAAWKVTWRSQGLPTDLEELNQWYAPVPADQNLALRYVEIGERLRALRSDWNNHIMAALPAAGPGATAQEAWEKQREAQSSIQNKVLVDGNASVERAEQIPADVWKWTRQYSDIVSSKVSADLHAATQSAFTGSRYPIDLRRLPNVDLPYLSQVRSLARQLYIEALVAAVERRPDAATNAALDMFPIAESLKDEPILISQLVYVAILSIAQSCVEHIMNRAALSEDQLTRLQESLTHVVAPMRQRPLQDRSMIGEEVLGLDFMALWRSLAIPGTSGFMCADRSGPLPVESLPRQIALQAEGLLGYVRFQSLVVLDRYTALRDWARETTRTGRIQYRPPEREFWTPHLMPRAILMAILMPAIERAYDSGWRIRTQLDLARTAVAVELFRLARGRLPQHLDELVPVFIERTPGDLYNEGRPLSYRIKDNGEYVIYSFGMNRQDDGGKERGKNEGPHDGDITFTVAPPEIRDRPQVAPAL